MLIIDEAARVEDAMYKALRPMLAVGNGDLWMMSTPYGKRGFFYEAWAHGTDWEKYSVTAEECPRINREYLERERSEMGAGWFGQEFLCCFLDSGSGVFDRDAVERALDESIAPFVVPR